MGTVFQAHQISLNRLVALKVLSQRLRRHPAFVQRFQREAQVMAQLDHPNILRCYEIRVVRGWHLLAMEFVDGGSLEDVLPQRGQLAVEDALYVAIACARALQHAHRLNLVHRDIKPENILLTSQGEVKVADLGLAKPQDDKMGLTRLGTGVGTPLYMPPEQARRAGRVDARSDIYALGGMLYRLVTGEAPFKCKSLLELIQAKEESRFTPARQLNPRLPEQLDRILARMLAGVPDQRYQNCSELLEQLEGLGLAGNRFLTREPAHRQP